LNTAYNDAAGRTPNITLNAGDNQLGGQTLTPGVYAVAAASTANIIGTLTLDGGGDSNAVFIFQMPSTLVTASSSKVVLTNGAQACNVFWQVGSSVTLNSSSTFVGNVLANATIVDSGSSTVNGRLLAGAITGSGALTLEHTTITKSTCASTSSTSSSTSSSTGGAGAPCIAPLITTVPIIIESKRISPTSISVSWGPYAGIDTFNVRYGLINGTWLYNTNVTGFSTTINALPPNQPIWIEVAATNSCSIGTYGVSKLVGEPSLPNTGLAPRQNNIPWYIPAGIGVTLLTLLVLIQRKYRFFV
jgi:hypothetical protein